MAKEVEVITIDSDDETPGPSTSSGMAGRQAPRAQPTNQTARTNGTSSTPVAKHQNDAFLLFCRDNRKLVSTKFPKLSMEALKRKVVEMWKALPEIEKSEYKRRVTLIDQSAKKIMKTKMPPLLDSRHQPRRSAITGFSIFSTEFRKTLPPSVSIKEALRKAEEAWLVTPKRTHTQYELKAARLTKGVGSSIIPAVSRPPDVPQVTAHSSPRVLSNLPNSNTGHAILANPSPGKVALPIPKSGQVIQPISNPGPVDSSKIILTPGLTLPSGITVSKVPNEKQTSVPNRKPAPGTSITMNKILPPRLPSSVPSPTQQTMQAKRLFVSPMRPIIDQRALNVKSCLRAKLQNPTRLKRFSMRPQHNHQAGTFHQNSLGLGPRLPTPNTARQSTIPHEQKESFVCRLCGEYSPSKWSFATKSDMLETLKFVFDLNIDVQKEGQFGISNRVCDVCFATMTASEMLKRRAIQLQEATDNFIAKNQGVKRQEEPDDEIIFVSEKKVQITSEAERTDRVMNSNVASNGTTNDQVTDKACNQSESTSPNISGNKKINSPLSLKSDMENLVAIHPDPKPEPFIPAPDLKVDSDKESNHVQNAQLEGTEKMFQTNPIVVEPIDTTDEAAPAT